MFKKLILSLVASCALPLSLSLASNAPSPDMTPGRVFSPTLKIFVPLGFDSNDQVQVVVWGRLPSSCYEFPKFSFQTKSEERKVNIEATSATKIRPGENCLNTQIDFVESITLGEMNSGRYVLAVNEGTPFQQYGDLNITEATSPNVDDFRYANVDRIEQGDYSSTFNLVGTNPNNCMVLDVINIVSNKKDVFAILPVMKKSTEPCDGKPQKFKYPFAISDELTAENILLHVRSMDGKSVNKVIRNIR